MKRMTTTQEINHFAYNMFMKNKISSLISERPNMTIEDILGIARREWLKIYMKKKIYILIGEEDGKIDKELVKRASNAWKKLSEEEKYSF